MKSHDNFLTIPLLYSKEKSYYKRDFKDKTKSKI